MCILWSSSLFFFPLEYFFFILRERGRHGVFGGVEGQRGREDLKQAARPAQSLTFAVFLKMQLVHPLLTTPNLFILHAFLTGSCRVQSTVLGAVWGIFSWEASRFTGQRYLIKGLMDR